MKNDYSVKISREKAKKILKKLFKDEYKGLTEFLLDSFQRHGDDEKLNFLLSTALNLTEELKYNIGDKVLVPEYFLDSWLFDIKLMRKQNNAIDDDVICIISNIKKYSIEPYEVEYQIINSKNEVKKHTSRISEYSIKESLANDFEIINDE